MRKIIKFTMVLAITLMLMGLFIMVSCGGKKKIDLDASPHYDEFFEKTRLIMLREEIKIYKHLPDKEAREAFIKEFWDKRDPNPATPENEAKIEFDRRIEFINRWFSEATSKNQGWESDRGRVYLLLGEPDERNTGYITVADRFGRLMNVKAEFWGYQRHGLYLTFRDNGFGEFRLGGWPTTLLAAMESEKFAIFDEKKVSERLKFKATYDTETSEIRVQIPVENVNFEEKESKMSADFKITVHIYYNYERIDEVQETRTFAAAKDEILKMQHIQLTIPYTLSSKGKYSFDIIVKDVVSGSSYRHLVEHKF